MARSRASGRRLAYRAGSEDAFEEVQRRHEVVVAARQASESNSGTVTRSASASATRSVSSSETSAGTVPAVGGPVPPPPAIATTPPDSTPVNIPTSISHIIPATAAVAGVLLALFLVWHFWYRRYRRKNKTNRLSTWYNPTKYSAAGFASIDPSKTPGSAMDKLTAASGKASAANARTVAPRSSSLATKDESSSSDKSDGTSYPPRKVASTPRGARGAVAGPSPLRKQSGLAPIPEAKLVDSPALTTPMSPMSPGGSTPTEKTSFVASPTLTAPPPVASHLRFSFLNDVNKMPDFRAPEPQRPQPVKRSASLLSSRMSTKRKPQRQDTAPGESGVPSLRITDADSPLEEDGEAASVHPMAGKLVSVTDPYDAAMPDELSVTVGETLRVIECYDDDWCLCERVGRKKGRGIIPQLCILEKGGVKAGARFSMLVRE